MEFGKKFAKAVGTGTLIVLTTGLRVVNPALGVAGGMITSAIIAGTVGIIGSEKFDKAWKGKRKNRSKKDLQEEVERLQKAEKSKQNIIIALKKEIDELKKEIDDLKKNRTDDAKAIDNLTIQVEYLMEILKMQG
ncbi:MAG: hypothetical protein PWP62_1559 [Eubacteriaceae bacterium]|nr:hypothetical protein [Eubacteriaceae bacterium]